MEALTHCQGVDACAEGLPAFSSAQLQHRCRCNPREDKDSTCRRMCQPTSYTSVWHAGGGAPTPGRLITAHGDAFVTQRHTSVWHAGGGAPLEAVRVHGAEGLLSIAPLQTPQMGAALAWISAGSQLTFGSLQLEPGLHWYTLGELTFSSLQLNRGLHCYTCGGLSM